MGSIIPKTRGGWFGFVSAIIYLIVMNGPVLKWVYTLQKPPNIVYVFGFPFAIFWTLVACVAMCVIWAYTLSTVGEDMVKNSEKSQIFKELLETQRKKEEVAR
jgi:hypothetical protein